MIEDKLQQECFLWHWNNFPKYRRLLFHPANGGSRNKIEAGKLKGMGVVPGIPDLGYCLNGSITWFELKTKSTLSDPQLKVAQAMQGQNIQTYFITSIEEFKTIINTLHCRIEKK